MEGSVCEHPDPTPEEQMELENVSLLKQKLLLEIHYLQEELSEVMSEMAWRPTTDREPRGIIPLKNLSIREVDDTQKPNCFELYIPNNKEQLIKACKMEADGWMVEGNHVVYLISAPMQEEKDQWIKSVQAAVSTGPF
ncbi:Cytohesin-2, partial [Eschrichtius robustus]|nr:Cytohesin-2 [Eschrichtius robustus]